MQQLVGLLHTIARVLLEAAHDQSSECRRHGRPVLGHRLRRFRDVCRDHLLRRRPLERGPPRQHLVGHHPECVDVRTVIDVFLRGRLLGSHVGRSADGHAGRRQRVAAGRFVQRLRDAEIGHQGMVPGEHHVVGLDVPVNQAAGMRILEGVGDVAQDPHGPIHRQPAFSSHQRAERLTLHVRHDVVEKLGGRSVSRAGGGRAGIVQRQDVGMLERRGDLDLAQEALGTEHGCDLGPEHLDGHLATVFQVLRQVHVGHAAGAEFALDGVTTGKSGLEERKGVGHDRVR
jgi:hypothetical protein